MKILNGKHKNKPIKFHKNKPIKFYLNAQMDMIKVCDL